MTHIEYDFHMTQSLLDAQHEYSELADILAKRRAVFEETNAVLIKQVDEAKQALDVARNEFNEEVIEVFQSTGQKKFCEGRVTIREIKSVVWRDKEAVAADVQDRFPGWMIPDWKRVTKAVKDGDTIEGAELEKNPSVAVNVEKWVNGQ